MCAKINVKGTMKFLHKFFPIFTAKYITLSVLYKRAIKNLQNEVFPCKNLGRIIIARILDS